MAFDPARCLIPSVWCGKGDVPEKKTDKKKNIKYIRSGTKDECVQKGFGAGMFTERRKGLPPTSLQTIKYVGDVFERHFQEEGINDLAGLMAFARRSTSDSIKKKILKVTTKKGGKIDHRAYNHILLWLYEQGIEGEKLPLCHRLISMD